MCWQSPLLEEGLARGIMNLSALARELRPGMEAELGKTVSPAAILMALKRLSPELPKQAGRKPAGLKKMGDLIVRSNLVEFTFRNSDSIWEKQKKLLHRIERNREAFLTYTQGVFEVMLLASAGIEKAVLEIFGGESVLARQGNLSAIVIRLSPADGAHPRRLLRHPQTACLGGCECHRCGVDHDGVYHPGRKGSGRPRLFDPDPVPLALTPFLQIPKYTARPAATTNRIVL